MGLPAFKEAFEDAVRLPTPPVFERAGRAHGSVDDLEFNRALRRFKSDFADWRTRMFVHEQKLRDLFEAASADENPAYLKFLIDELMPAIIQVLEDFLESIRGRIEPPEAMEKDLAATLAKSASARRFWRLTTRRYREAMTEQYNVAVSLYYRLIALQADFDPDARGGTEFENADDLIAFLRS